MTTISEKTARHVIADTLDFPEGPAFDSKGNLWVVELKGGNLVQLSASERRRFPTSGSPNGIAIDVQDRVWFCDAGQNAIRCFDPKTKAFETKCDTINGEPLFKPNDLAFDDAGNLLFTCPGDSRTVPTGYACVLSPDGIVQKIADQMYFPNGLALTNDGKQLVMAETYKHRLWKGEWNAATRQWASAKVWCETGGPDGPGGPDGMAFDNKGFLYAAVFGVGKVKVIDLSGSIVDEIRVPGLRPTNCAFDPNGGDLVITEAELGVICKVSLGVTGGRLFKR